MTHPTTEDESAKSQQFSEEELKEKKQTEVLQDNSVETLLPEKKNRQNYSTYYVYAYQGTIIVTLVGENGSRINISRAPLSELALQIRQRKQFFEIKLEAATRNSDIPVERFNFAFQSNKHAHISDLVSRSIKRGTPLSQINLKYARVNVTDDLILFFQLDYKTREHNISLDYGALLQNFGILVKVSTFMEIMSHLDAPRRSETIETVKQDIQDDV